jgi:hypothetical protein
LVFCNDRKHETFIGLNTEFESAHQRDEQGKTEIETDIDCENQKYETSKESVREIMKKYSTREAERERVMCVCERERESVCVCARE